VFVSSRYDYVRSLPQALQSNAIKMSIHQLEKNMLGILPFDWRTLNLLCIYPIVGIMALAVHQHNIIRDILCSSCTYIECMYSD
jgi:hypothetical protein